MINLFGECNAFETNWYNEETIETVQEILSQWSESIVKNSFHKYEDWKPYLDILDNYPAREVLWLWRFIRCIMIYRSLK